METQGEYIVDFDDDESISDSEVWVDDIKQLAMENDDYRYIAYTSGMMQIVVMELEVGEEIEKEVHDESCQLIRVESGVCVVEIGDTEEIELVENQCVAIPAGVEHRVVNASIQNLLKLSVIYAPPEHDDDEDVDEMAEV